MISNNSAAFAVHISAPWSSNLDGSAFVREIVTQQKHIFLILFFSSIMPTRQTKKRRRRESEMEEQEVPRSVTDEQQGQLRRSLRVAAAANSSTTTSSDTSTTTNSDTRATRNNTSSSTASRRDALPVVVPALPVDAAEARVNAEIQEAVAQCESRRRGQARPNIYIPDLAAYRTAWCNNMRNIRKLVIFLFFFNLNQIALNLINSTRDKRRKRWQ